MAKKKSLLVKGLHERRRKRKLDLRKKSNRLILLKTVKNYTATIQQNPAITHSKGTVKGVNPARNHLKVGGRNYTATIQQNPAKVYYNGTVKEVNPARSNLKVSGKNYTATKQQEGTIQQLYSRTPQ